MEPDEPHQTLNFIQPKKQIQKTYYNNQTVLNENVFQPTKIK